MVIVALVGFGSMACAGGDRPIKMDELPKAAQTFLGKYFPNMTPAYITKDSDIFDADYAVGFANGDKVDFSKDGTWKDLDCTQSQVPVEVVPAPILKYVVDHYPAVKIKKIERDNKGYEVKLDNRLELTFDRKYRLVEIDS